MRLPVRVADMRGPAILQMARNALADLGGAQQRLFQSYYVDLQPKEVAAQAVGVAPEQFEQLHQEMLSRLRYG